MQRVLFPLGCGNSLHLLQELSAHVPHPVSDGPCPSHQLFNDAIRLAVAYKQHSGDFMDEVLRELEVGKALSLLILTDEQFCSFSSVAKGGGHCAAREALPSAGDHGGFMCCSCLGWEGGSGNHWKSSQCPRRSLKATADTVVAVSVTFQQLLVLLLSRALTCRRQARISRIKGRAALKRSPHLPRPGP